jgi:uncharacterized membrane protein (DUF106 family)
MNQAERIEALRTRAQELQFAARKTSGKQRLKHLASLSKIQQQIAGITGQYKTPAKEA